MIFTIAQHEWMKWFKTGKIWKLLALCQFILGLIFYWLMEEFLLKARNAFLGAAAPFTITEEVIHPLFAWTAILFFFITPMLATNSLTQERKASILNLYFTSAVSATDIIVGKFLGLLLVEIFLLLPVFLMPLLVFPAQTTIDIGQWLSGILGLIFLLGTTLSLAMCIASFAREPLMAGLLSLISFFLLTLLEWIAPFLQMNFKWLIEISLLYHCKNFFSGVVHSRDIVYYSICSGVFLYVGKSALAKTTSNRLTV